MKKIFFAVITITSLAITACNSNNDKEKENHDMDKMKDTTGQAAVVDDKEIKTVAVTYANVDSKIAASMKEIVDHYLHIKNALANDNSLEAANGGEAMFAAIGKIDKSLFTVDQKKVYGENEEDLKEHAEHLGVKHYNWHFLTGSQEYIMDLAKKGFNLYMGKAKCGTCHFVPLFNGLLPPDFSDTESEVLGVPADNNKKNPKLDTDEGKFLHSRSLLHKFSFKTPTLRNIGLTAPYMHNGVFKTLEEVVEFYNNGGGAGLNIAPENQTLPGDKLALSKKEMKAIIAFMHSLTDSAVLKYR